MYSAPISFLNEKNSRYLTVTPGTNRHGSDTFCLVRRCRLTHCTAGRSGTVATQQACVFTALISAYEFDVSAQDVALLRNISKVSATAHMPFIGSAGPKFFLKGSMEEVATIKDIGNYFDRAEYIKWKSSVRQTMPAISVW